MLINLDELCIEYILSIGFVPCLGREGWWNHPSGTLDVIQSDPGVFRVCVNSVPESGIPSEALGMRRCVPVSLRDFELWLNAVMASSFAGQQIVNDYV